MLTDFQSPEATTGETESPLQNLVRRTSALAGRRAAVDARHGQAQLRKSLPTSVQLLVRLTQNRIYLNHPNADTVANAEHYQRTLKSIRD